MTIGPGSWATRTRATRGEWLASNSQQRPEARGFVTDIVTAGFLGVRESPRLAVEVPLVLLPLRVLFRGIRDNRDPGVARHCERVLVFLIGPHDEGELIRLRNGPEHRLGSSRVS